MIKRLLHWWRWLTIPDYRFVYRVLKGMQPLPIGVDIDILAAVQTCRDETRKMLAKLDSPSQNPLQGPD